MPAIDWVALSFVQRPEDVADVRKTARGRALVMSKIEKPQAIARLDEIMEISDALMVARGDLGVEMPLEKVPGLQKRITRNARRLGKPVVVATQMLELMITAPVPTRAEVSDVATAVFEGADAVMLSAEIAAGQYPVEAVATMNRIAEEVESRPDLPQHHQCPALPARGDGRGRHRRRDPRRGRDARPQGHRGMDGIGRHRPAHLARTPAAADPGADAEHRHGAASRAGLGRPRRRHGGRARRRTTWPTEPAAHAFTEGFANAGQRVIIVAGVPFGTPGATNMVRIAFVGPEGQQP